MYSLVPKLDSSYNNNTAPTQYTFGIWYLAGFRVRARSSSGNNSTVRWQQLLL